MVSLTPLVLFLSYVECQYYLKYPKKGRGFTYRQSQMLLFFMAMFMKGIFTFKGMATYASHHYPKYGFVSAPSRKTIRRRFYGMSTFLLGFIPLLAYEVIPLDERFKSLGVGYIDKCLFWTKGGLWHKKDIKTGRVPHPSIDTEASWGFTPHRKRWVFGYSLHAIVNRYRFPLAACVSTAKDKDYNFIKPLLEKLFEALGAVIGDKGYRSQPVIKAIFDRFKTLVITNKPYKNERKTFAKWYNQIVRMKETVTIYWMRRAAVEPFFSLVKELFHLTDRNKLPYRGLEKNKTFLLITVVTIQSLMIFNSIHNLNLRAFAQFKTLMI